MRELIIENIEGYLKVLSEIDHNGIILFRGMDDNHELLPKIARKEYSDLELEKVISTFKNKSYPYLSSIPQYEIDWLVVAQHYGLPTCLLDWTESALVALWFAVQGNKTNSEIKKQPVVWVILLASSDLKEISSNSLNELDFSNHRTEFFQPKCISERIANQGAWMSLHTKKDNHFIALENNNQYKDNLIKLKITPEKCEDMEKILELCGINVLTLFPNLDSLTKHIIKSYKYYSYGK